MSAKVEQGHKSTFQIGGGFFLGGVSLEGKPNGATFFFLGATPLLPSTKHIGSHS